MIKVVVGNNLVSKEIVIATTATIAEAIEESGVIIGSNSLMLNGMVIMDTNMTFEDYGIKAESGEATRVFLRGVTKTDNAAE